MKGVSQSEKEFLKKLTELVEANLDNEKFGVSELASEIGMSRSNLHRKVNKMVNISVSQFIRRIRLKKALDMLRKTGLTVSEVTWKVGFGSTSYFIKCFRDHYGYPPGKVGDRELEVGEIIVNKKSGNFKFNKTFKYAGTVLFAILLIVVVILFKDRFFPVSQNVEDGVEDELVINISTENHTSNPQGIFDEDCLVFLLRDAFLRSTDKYLLKENQFKSIYLTGNDETKKPAKEINVTIQKFDFYYELALKVKNNISGKTSRDKIQFKHPNELLMTKLNDIVSFILDEPVTTSPVTRDWDAFFTFINGKKSWNDINKTVAKMLLVRSIDIDPSFLLPQLELAKIYKFEGNNTKALDLLSTIIDQRNVLNVVDSIQALALENALLGKQRDCINNYKELLSYMPATKEVHYEIAEAYFSIRDIKNAKLYYNNALKIDPKYANAVNHLAYCYTHEGDHKEAENYFRKYVQLDTSANSFDSFGDGFYAAGEYDSARIYKSKGLEIDPGLDYLYNSLCYIDVATGNIEEAEKNINLYLKLQKEPEMICNGLTLKSFIYYSIGDYKAARDTCLRAKSIFDSENLISRNHKMHWLLAKTNLLLGEKELAEKEINEMDQIIAKYGVHENNYNEILKFYKDLKFLDYCEKRDMEGINEVLELFDMEIRNKIKDWSSPFDLAFFNTEFGIELMNIGEKEMAKERFAKALEYNPNYPKANYYMYDINLKENNLTAAEKYKSVFNNVLKNADPDYFLSL